MAKDAKQFIADTMAGMVEKLIALVEASDGTNWVQPWINLGLGKQLRNNGEPYRGINQLMLALIAAADGLEGPHIWAGYRQWIEMGYQVRKGQHSMYHPIRAYRIFTCSVHGRVPETVTEQCCPEMKSFLKLKTLAAIFHLSQVDPIEDMVQVLPDVGTEPAPVFVPSETAATVLNGWRANGMEFREVDSDRAYYSPLEDYINLPPLGAFQSESGWLSTLFHEATHWTGHTDRLNRAHGVFGSPVYAQEELVAEIGAALFGAQVGFETEPDPQHAEYLANWLRVLRGDPTKLYDAVNAAERASEFLVEFGKVKVSA